MRGYETTPLGHPAFNEDEDQPLVIPTDNRPSSRDLAKRAITSAVQRLKQATESKPHEPLNSAGVQQIEQQLKERNPDALILLHKLTAKLEGREGLDSFDGASVRLLGEVLQNDDRSLILKHIARSYPGILAFLTPKAGGALTALVGSKMGSSWAVHAAAKAIATTVLLNERGILGAAKRAANETLIIPVIESIAGLVGSAASIAFGILAYFVGAGLIGGTLGVMRERRKETGFEPLRELIDNLRESESAGNFKGEDGNDLRLKLVELVHRYSEDTASRRNLTNDEWLRLVAAARRARVSLIEENTAPTMIIADPTIRRYLEEQKGIVDKITHRWEDLRDADLETAEEILAQFERHIDNETQGIPLGAAEQRSQGERLRAYAAAFVREGYRASGIPLFLNLTSLGLKSVNKISKPVRKLRA